MPSACGVARANAQKCFAIPDKERQGGKIRQHCRNRTASEALYSAIREREREGEEKRQVHNKYLYSEQGKLRGPPSVRPPSAYSSNHDQDQELKVLVSRTPRVPELALDDGWLLG
eukprot:16434297-Heterocapsa_arctica.AAC.1